MTRTPATSEDHITEEARVDKPRLRMARPVAKLRQGRTDWYRITTNKADGAEIFIYDEIGWFGLTAQDFVNELRQIDRDRIALHLNSPGGEVFDGIAIYNALRDHPAEVTVCIDSLAASIASVIAMAGDRIRMARNGQMMIHDALTMTIGNAEDHAKATEMLSRTSDTIADTYAQRAGGTAAAWRKIMKAETWYTAKEALDAGLIDEISGTSSSKDDWDLSIFNYAGRTHAPAPEPLPATSEVDGASIADALKGAFA